MEMISERQRRQAELYCLLASEADAFASPPWRLIAQDDNPDRGFVLLLLALPPKNATGFHLSSVDI